MKTALILFALVLNTTLHAQSRLEQTKALCREYTAGFISPATDLAYGKRINGPKGIAALEKPSEIMAGRVYGKDKPMGYGSGIEDLAYHNALLLYALCDAEEKTGEPLFAEMAHRTFRGLVRMLDITPHRGFVPRGPHPDGKSFYKDSSLDQHTLYLCGLWRYYHSRLITEPEKVSLREAVSAVIGRLKNAGWAIQVEDGKTKSWEGGSMLVQDGKMPLVLLCIVGIAADITDDAALKADYERFATEDNARRFASLAKPQDITRPRRYTMFQNQHIIRAETLRRIETDPKRREILHQRSVETAEDMLKSAYLHAFRALEWLGDEPTKDASLIPAANRYLAPLGLTFDSPITSLELLKMFDPERRNPETGANHAERYEGVALANPALVCQIALFSEKPEFIAAVQPSIDHLLTKVDWKKVNMGWAINYGTLAALWSLPAEPKAPPAGAGKAEPKKSASRALEKPILPPGAEYGRRLDAVPLGVGSCMDAAIVGDFIYAIGGDRLSILEGVRAAKPPKVGELSGLGHLRQIAVSGGHAYITAREDGLFIVDVRDPAKPAVVFHYDTVELATGIAVSGDVAAVANRFAGIELLDVSTPAKPRHLATVRVGEAQSVVFHGPWLYAGIWQTDAVAVIDVSDPRQPKHVRSVPLDGHGDGLDVNGNLLAAATGHHARSAKSRQPGDATWGAGHGIEFFDLSNPAEPKRLSGLKFPPFYRLGMDMWGVVLAGSYAFVNDTYNGFFLIDVREPAKPVSAGHRQLPTIASRAGDPSPAAGLTVTGGRAFVAGGWDDLHIIETGLDQAEPVQNPQPLHLSEASRSSKPAASSAYRVDGQVHAVRSWKEDQCLVAAGLAGLHIVRFDGNTLTKVAVYPTRGFARDVDFHGDMVCVAESAGGLSIWKRDTSGALNRIGSYEVPGETIHQVVLADEGRMAFLAVGGSRLHAIRISADGNTERVLTDSHSGLFYRQPFSPIGKDGRSILAQWHVTGLYEYKAEAGSAACTGHLFPHGVGTESGSVSWRDGWLGTARKGFLFIQPGQAPASMPAVTQVQGQPLVGKPSVDGDTLFVADPFLGTVTATDLSDPTKPKAIATLKLAGHPGRIRVAKGKALIPAGHDGLVVWDYLENTSAKP